MWWAVLCHFQSSQPLWDICLHIKISCPEGKQDSSVPLLQGLGCMLVRKSLSLNIRNTATRKRNRHENQAPSRRKERINLLQHCSICDSWAHVLWGPQKSLEETGYHEVLWVKRKEKQNPQMVLLTWWWDTVIPYPSFPAPPASRTVLTTELLRSILISSQEVEKISGLDFKAWPEGSRRVLQNACPGHSAVLHRAWLCCQRVQPGSQQIRQLQD